MLLYNYHQVEYLLAKSYITATSGAVIFFELSKCLLAISDRIDIPNPPSHTSSWNSDHSLSVTMELRSVDRKVLLMMSSSGFRCPSISCIVLMK